MGTVHQDTRSDRNSGEEHQEAGLQWGGAQKSCSRDSTKSEEEQEQGRQGVSLIFRVLYGRWGSVPGKPERPLQEGPNSQP